MENQIVQKMRFSNNLLSDAQVIINAAKSTAYKIVDTILIQRNWLLGKRIAIEVLKGDKRSEYGEEVRKKLAKELTEKEGAGFSKTNLYSYLRFYEYYPDIFHAVSGESGEMIFHAVSGKYCQFSFGM